MQMDAGLDTGAMGLVGREPIAASDTTASLHDRLALLGGQLIVQACGSHRPMPQPLDGITYAHKIEKAESVIDWRQSAAEIERRLRAFDPSPAAAPRPAARRSRSGVPRWPLVTLNPAR